MLYADIKENYDANREHWFLSYGKFFMAIKGKILDEHRKQVAKIFDDTRCIIFHNYENYYQYNRVSSAAETVAKALNYSAFKTRLKLSQVKAAEVNKRYAYDFRSVWSVKLATTNKELPLVDAYTLAEIDPDLFDNPLLNNLNFIHFPLFVVTERFQLSREEVVKLNPKPYFTGFNSFGKIIFPYTRIEMVMENDEVKYIMSDYQYGEIYKVEKFYYPKNMFIERA